MKPHQPRRKGAPANPPPSYMKAMMSDAVNKGRKNDKAKLKAKVGRRRASRR
jgi:hypothetical protein